MDSVNSEWLQSLIIIALWWCGCMKRSLRRRLGWPPIQLHGTLVKLTMQNWTRVNERGRAIGHRQSADEQGARSSKLKHTKERLSIIRAQTPAYGVQSTPLSACNHTHTHTLLLHPTMFMLILIFPAHTVKGPLNTPCQRYWATHMHTHSGSAFNITKVSLQW